MDRDTYTTRSPITPELIETIRAAAAEETERTSLRALAPRIGVGHSTLHNFLNGANPHPRLRRLLYDWYAGGTAAESAFHRLLGDLAEDVRARVRGRVARELARGYRDSRRDVPAWLSTAADGEKGADGA